jgi:murein DD-endopeptidase MepM/ murein hydrolase activator NlpD
MKHARRVVAVIAAAGALSTVPGVVGFDVDRPAQAAPVAEIEFTAFPQPHPANDFWNSWGAGRSGGRRHQGIDIMGEKGWPIVAAADGIVIRVDTTRRAGNHVFIKHGRGWETWYMHLNNDTPGTDDGKGTDEFAFAPDIEEGAYVEAGQLIGFVGDSGNAEGKKAHLHFELRYNDRAVNPYPYLDAAWQRQLRLWERANEVQ